MNILIIVTLLVIAAETSYLVAQSARKVSHRKFYKPIFVDTSVLIDGRIISVAQSGFITSTLYIPRSVVGELQLLADQGDHEKRSRARHGLDIVSELQAMPNLEVKIFADSNTASEGVDNRLLKLAKRYKGSICTIDYNLNKVAQVENIPVLNVNSLAMTLRMSYLPGEKMMLELTQKGNDGHQAVGHLADGTMVVVEHASSQLGKKVEIEFIRSLQTAAGKMMFAKLTEKPKSNPKPPTADKIPRPIGKAPVKAPVKPSSEEPKVEVQPQQQQQPQPQPRRNNQQPRQQSNNNRDRSQNTQNQGQNQGRPAASRRPRTSSQKEDDLIKLLNSQE